MTVSQYRKAARAFTNSSVNVLYVMSIVMVVLFSIFPSVAFFFDGASFSYAYFIMFLLMMYTIAQMTLSESHPVFEGTQKPKKGLTLSDMRGRTALYQLPAGRETVVRSYIGIDRALSGMIFLSAALFGMVLIIKPAAFIFSASVFMTYLALFYFVLKMADLLRSGAPEKTLRLRQNIYTFSCILVWVFFLFDNVFDKLLIASAASDPVPSVICGILCIILGIVSMIIMSRLHKRLLSDCKNRSISGEFIERNDENA
ncbi:MAG: hypothetical protein J5997_01020 [Oscillospiraceae bacterium]|nr:hypothetical protein [Oscillospiraceae bacterium]